MPNGSEQASAYLSEAETTLQSARVLAEDDPDTFASQIVKNAYDAVGTGAFGRRRSAWRGRSATTRREDPTLLRTARRPRAGRDGVRLALAPEQRTVRRFQGIGVVGSVEELRSGRCGTDSGGYRGTPRVHPRANGRRSVAPGCGVRRVFVRVAVL